MSGVGGGTWAVMAAVGIHEESGVRYFNLDGTSPQQLALAQRKSLDDDKPETVLSSRRILTSTSLIPWINSCQHHQLIELSICSRDTHLRRRISTTSGPPADTMQNRSSYLQPH